MDMFGGKLMSGIMALVVLFVAVVSAGIMAAPIGSLGAYFDDSAEITAGSNKGEKFKRVYTGVTGDAEPTKCQINTDTQRAGGAGATVAAGTSSGAAPGSTAFSTTACDTVPAAGTVYNEQGTSVGTSDAAGDVTFTSGLGIKWKSPPSAYNTLSGLNNILVTVLALTVIIGIIMKTRNAYQAFNNSSGAFDIGKGVFMEIGSLVVAIFGTMLTPTLLNLFAESTFVFISGQFDFSLLGQIMKVLIGLVPTVALLGLMVLVSGAPVGRVSETIGSRARSAIGGGFGRMRGMRGRMAY